MQKPDFRFMRKDRKSAYVFADLFRAVRLVSKSDRDTIATIVDLFDRDRVRFLTAGREVRVRVSQSWSPCRMPKFANGSVA